MTLTAEGLRVLPGQLPFQRPAGEGKAYGAEPTKQTGGAWGTPGALDAALGGWGMGAPHPHPILLVTLLLGWREGHVLSPGPDGSHSTVESLCVSSMLGLPGPSTYS